MADFRIWGRVEHIGPSQFFVIASAIPEVQSERATVLTLTADSLGQESAEKARLMIQVGEVIRWRGDRVVDVESP